MPIFEYICYRCGHEFEALVLQNDANVACSRCQGSDLKKLVSVAAVSSQQTRRRALQTAQQKREKARFDKEYEEHKRFHHHHDD